VRRYRICYVGAGIDTEAGTARCTPPDLLSVRQRDWIEEAYSADDALVQFRVRWMATYQGDSWSKFGPVILWISPHP
jgi:hypothetical protein